MNDDWMSWDIKLSLALARMALAAMVGWALIPWIQRAIKWHRVRPYASRTSYITYRPNTRRVS